jgi:hypothetical protein
MKIETKCQGSEFEKFDSVLKALLSVPKSEIAEQPKKKKRRKKKQKKN